MIQRWSIRAAIIATDLEPSPLGHARRMPPRPERTNVRLLGYEETGGEIASTEWSNGLEWRGPFPQFSGTVADSGGNPISGAVVRLNNTHYDDSVITDRGGRFAFPPVTPGYYRVFVADSLFAAYGVLGVLPKSLLLSRENRSVDLELASRAQLLRRACGDQKHAAGDAAILGRVLSEDGSPATGVHVDATWLVSNSTSLSAQATRRGDTDGEGRFVICGVPRDAGIVVHVATRRDAAEERVDRITADAIGVTLQLRRRP
jgi:hypothetical protein